MTQNSDTTGKPKEVEESVRKTSRVSFEEEVTFLSPEKFTAHGKDIGAGGVGVLMPVELPVGAGVEIQMLSGHAIVFGTIRWVKKAEEGFEAGIMFRSEDWSIIEMVLSLREQQG